MRDGCLDAVVGVLAADAAAAAAAVVAVADVAPAEAVEEAVDDVALVVGDAGGAEGLGDVVAVVAWYCQLLSSYRLLCRRGTGRGDERLTLVKEGLAAVDAALVAGVGGDAQGDGEESDDGSSLHVGGVVWRV